MKLHELVPPCRECGSTLISPTEKEKGLCFKHWYEDPYGIGDDNGSNDDE